MINEFIFFIYIVTISSALLIALKLGKETLVALISVQAIFANLFISKEITLFGFSATATDALAVGATLGLNIVQEFYGKALAKKAIWISFFCTFFYTVITLLHLAYIPTLTDTASVHFQALLFPMPRIIIASLSTYLIVQQLECQLYAYLTQKLHHAYFIIRNYSSVAITQLIDTILFTFLGLYGINQNFCKLSTLAEIIIVSYTIKLLVLSIAAPFLVLSKKIIKKSHE